MLSVLPCRYGQIAMSIETLVDLDMLSINEHRMSCSRSGHAMAGRLNAAEERYALDHDLTAGIGELLLTEEWRTRTKSRGGGSSDGGLSSGGSGGDRRHGKGCDRGKDVTRRDGNSSGATRNDECRYCGKKGWTSLPQQGSGSAHVLYNDILLTFTISSVCMIICDRAYTRADILKMERTIVDMLELDVFVTIPYCLMRRFPKVTKSDKKGNFMSSFPLQQQCMALAKKFAVIRFKDGETVDNFIIRIMGLMS
ncbi:hypothetical protein QYE76_020515 [Lolium multiflorum]|uniref:Uncharacterized protein n=1 Tax=Lolium multiflorum TaxID=4521 RepID=A0AAD8R902_LOLMU|nr:hypothetical protein QYE76_020515 [Lolium multiflorum]